MCGIFAIARRVQPVDVREIKCACSLMKHRGPDQSGYALLNNGMIGFGHNRLSIQDPSAPPQPLTDPATGTTIIFNGEVYDHLEIGHNLKKDHGITLTEFTDTAVILALYTLYGPTSEFFLRLNGEFAFVIWDAQRKKLVAGRDRFGIKPLQWYSDSSKMIFASEIKAILSVEGVERKLSGEWLDNFSVSQDYSSDLTFAEGVHNVLPAHYITFDMTEKGWDGPKYTKYWSPLPLLHSIDTSITYEEAKKELRRLLTESVKRRLVADREICVYLSGGVDSTVICGIVHSLGHPLTSITIGFGDHLLSEEDVAVKSAEFYSIKHEKINVTAEDTALNVERAIYHTEMPLLNPHSIAKFCLAEFAHQKGFVVALTGEGSDELLLGYSPFRMDVILDMRARGQGDKVDKLMDDFKKREAKGAEIMLGQFPAETPSVRGTPSWLAWHLLNLQKGTDDLRAPYQDGHMLPARHLDSSFPEEADGLGSARMAQTWWLKNLHNYIFPCLGDRVEMASSIEGRPPILDPTVAEYVLRLPQEHLIHPETLREKRVFYEAFEDILPPHIFTRTKQPFMSPPWHEALFGTAEGHKLVDKYMSREALERAGVWNPERIEQLMNQSRGKGGGSHLDNYLGITFTVQILHALFIEKPRLGDPDFPMMDKTLGNKVGHN